MKKILLSSLLGLFGLVGAFASADSVNWFTSDSTIKSYTFNEYTELVSYDDVFDLLSSNFYVCIYSDDYPFQFNPWGCTEDDWNGCTYPVNSQRYCVPMEQYLNESEFVFRPEIKWTLYISETPITVDTNSWWWDINEDDSDSLLIWWVGALNPIISSLQNTFVEFIPYIVYIWLWILGAVIWFFAIRWLVNWVRAKVYWTFSSWRRR